MVDALSDVLLAIPCHVESPSYGELYTIGEYGEWHQGCSRWLRVEIHAR